MEQKIAKLATKTAFLLPWESFYGKDVEHFQCAENKDQLQCK